MKVNQFAERLIKSLKIKIYKKLTANDIKSCLGFLNELIDKCNNSYHRSISKKGIYADYFALNNEIKKNPETSKVNVSDRVRNNKYKNISCNNYTKNW